MRGVGLRPHVKFVCERVLPEYDGILRTIPSELVLVWPLHAAEGATCSYNKGRNDICVHQQLQASCQLP